MIKPKVSKSKHVNFGTDLAPRTVRIGPNFSITRKKK